MYFIFLILCLLTLLPTTIASPFKNGTTSKTFFPRGKAGSRNDGIPTLECAGSLMCTLLELPREDCIDALDRFEDETFYKHYTARWSGRCIAMLQCDQKKDWTEEGWKGSYLKQGFNYIINNCDEEKPCGASYFRDTCRVTLNFCQNCHDKG